jgi:hypothetical protein
MHKRVNHSSENVYRSLLSENEVFKEPRCSVGIHHPDLLHCLPPFVLALPNRELSIIIVGRLEMKKKKKKRERKDAGCLTLKAQSVSLPANQTPHC